MKKLILVLSFIMVNLMSYGDTEVKNEKFAINFMNEYTYQEYQIPVGDGTTTPLMIYVAENPKLTTSLTSAPIADEVLSQYDTNTILESSIMNGITQSGGVLVETKDVKLGKYSGKEGKYTVTQGVYIYKCYIRAYVVDKEIYVLGTVALQDDYVAVSKFFDSFKILK